MRKFDLKPGFHPILKIKQCLQSVKDDLGVQGFLEYFAFVVGAILASTVPLQRI